MEDKPDEYSGRQSDIYVVFGLESEIMRKICKVYPILLPLHIYLYWISV